MLEQDFLAFINDNHLFDTTKRVLLAVSGGLDSIVMAELVHRIKQPFAIAHVNFGLRGTDSDADALFVKNKADDYGVPFHLTHFDTAALAAARKVSIQMVARELRYNWFAQLIREQEYTGVATAHHLNDVLETMLFNLTRGTGLAGLHGIARYQDGVARPLLFATRAQLAAFADEQALAYREDSSNADDKYARNRIRHHVVPVLTELNPGLWQTLPHTLERLRAAEVLMQTELTRSWRETTVQQGSQTLLPAATLNGLPEPAFRLAEWLKPFGFTTDQAGKMVECLTKPAGQLFASATHRVMHERAGLVLELLPVPADYEISLPDWSQTPILVPGRFTLTVDVMPRPTRFELSANRAVAYLDADKLQLPLTIRPWQQGDRMRPLGMGGHKLVSDVLNDLKLSRMEREQTAVMVCGHEIAWVIGLRIDHRFRITSETKRIAHFRCDAWQSEPVS
ncbi:tRNA lysidine(34) synthetase TilS [Spirosoma spitsbergense]|uniref:tRNA lysidine(34) synthetase TilS n=1 Tax=Spirosoma spitsbergense TaxID=431554 RepID=UPI00036A966B|nr:tRNA lysidine(34) synthetase TilS [Spirosoma spitsbergense]